MSQAQTISGRPCDRCSAVTMPSSGCVGSSGSRQTSNVERRQLAAGLGDDDRLDPGLASAASGYSISARPRACAIAFAPPMREPAPARENGRYRRLHRTSQVDI